MAIDRSGARRRVRAITGWTAGGAAVLTAVFAFGASRGSNAAKATTRSGSTSPDAAGQDALPQSVDPQPSLPQAPQGVSPQDQQGGQGFTPPSSSTAPPSGMSGGS
jgi:hypothetical protein